MTNDETRKNVEARMTQKRDVGFRHSGFIHHSSFAFRHCFVAGVLTLALLFAGCTAGRYRRAADKEVYSIIQDVERQIFGQTNRFDISTRYSSREPAAIPADEIIDDRQQVHRRFLTLEDALRLAVTNSRTFQTEKERLYLAALSLTGERYTFSPHFFAGSTVFVRRSFALDDDNDAIADQVGVYSGGVESSIGFSKLMKTGGSISASLANSIIFIYTGQGSGPKLSSLLLELSQPLLRGFGAHNQAAENLTQAERNVIYAIREFGFFHNEFAADIVADYFSLLTQKDVIRNRYTNYLGRVKSTQRLVERADREKVSDVGQTRQAELTAKNNYVNAVAQYQTALDQFKIRLGLPLGERIQLDDNLLRELAATGLVPVELDADEAFRVAVQQQLRILNRIDEFEDSKRKVLVAANRLQADLNIFADASLGSEGVTDYTNFDPDKIRASAGISLNLPIDRLRERNTYRASLVSFESELRVLSLRLDELKDGIERGLRTLDQRRENYQIQQNALQVANSRVEGALANMEAGRVEVRELVDAQDAQINALNAVTSALVGYQEARLQLMLDLGLLDTQPEKFWLKDHVRGRLQAQSPAPRQRPVEGDELVPPEKLFEN